MHGKTAGSWAHRTGNYMDFNNRRLVEVAMLKAVSVIIVWPEPSLASQVWLDEYKDMYYAGNPSAKQVPYVCVSSYKHTKKQFVYVAVVHPNRFGRKENEIDISSD